MSSRLRTTVRSSRSTPSSRISVTAWLSSVPSFSTPITVYSGTRSGASRPSSKTLPPKRDRTCPVGGDFTAYIVPLLHTSPPPTPPRESLSQRAPREEGAASPGVKSSPSPCARSGKLVRVDTRDAETRLSGPEHREERGLGAWIRRNPWLLVRLFIVMVFTFGASTTAANFSYGLEGKPAEIDIAELRDGRLPAGVQLGDYVQVTGTPDFGPAPE